MFVGAPVVNGGAYLCLVLVLLYRYKCPVECSNYFAEKKIAGCLTFILFLLSSGC